MQLLKIIGLSLLIAIAIALLFIHITSGEKGSVAINIFVLAWLIAWLVETAKGNTVKW